MLLRFTVLAVVSGIAGIAASSSTTTQRRDVELSALGDHLLRFESGAEPTRMTAEEYFSLLRQGKSFIDVSKRRSLRLSVAESTRRESIFNPPCHHKFVNSLFKKISLPRAQSYLRNMTAFQNRMCWGPYGRESSDWLLSTVTAIASTRPDLTFNITAWDHTWWDPIWEQQTVTVAIEGRNKDAPATILGAHYDSINWVVPPGGTFDDTRVARAPGADDDGTGSMTLLETLKILLASGYKPETTLEFHWYSCEEMGLIGSDIVADEYTAESRQIKGMLMLDMTAYFQPGTNEVISVVTNGVDPALTEYIRALVDEYLSLPWEDDELEFGSSDHSSWIDHGYPASFVFETRAEESNPTIHTSADVEEVVGFSWTHATEFIKLAIAFVVEMTAA